MHAQRATPARPLARRGDYVLLPSAARPKLVVPAAPAAAAAGAVRGFKASADPRTRLALRGIAALARLGAVRALPDRLRIEGTGAALSAELAAALGRPVHLSLYVSPPRAVRKPVLQLLDDQGRTFAFAKLGLGAFTSALVRDEAEALRRLQAHDWSVVRLPDVLHAGQWQGDELLVLGALPTGTAPPALSPLLARAMVEVSAAAPAPAAPLADSSYRQALGERIAALPAGPLATRLADGLATVVERSGALRYGFGAAHGDWAPWNMAVSGDQLCVWDWEKFSLDVPVGWDAVHYSVQGDVVQNGTDPVTAFARTREQAAELVRWTGLDTPAARELVTLYALDLAARYLADGEASAGDTQLGHVARWLDPVLDAGR